MSPRVGCRPDLARPVFISLTLFPHHLIVDASSSSYLSYLMRPKPIAAPVEEDSSPSSSSSHIPSAADSAPKGHTARLQEAFKMPDFTSMFVGGMGSSSSSSREGKSSKFPEKTIKVLDEKLRSIFMGKDPA